MSQKSRKRTSKSQSKEVTINVDKIWDLAVDTWGKIRSHQVTIKVDPR